MLTVVLRTSALRARIFRPLNRLAANESCATAVEFGLVAAPFLALLVALLQTAMVFLPAACLTKSPPGQAATS